MKIKKFESLNLDISNGYTEEIDNKIEKINSVEEKIIYFVTTPDDKEPLSRSNYTTLEQALNLMNQLNNSFTDKYCIFECKVKALKKSDIERLKNIKKYNL
jgi:hypothetical protein